MSADVLKFKRGTTAQCNAYLPALGEPVYDSTLKTLKIGDGVAFGGVDLPNVGSAARLTTPRSVSVTGAITGSVVFDGSVDVSLTSAVGPTLQAALDTKAPLASPALIGVPTSPTAAVDTATTQVASTAFVVGQAASVAPLVDGTAAVGTSLRYARQDHVHPTDASRAPLASPSLTGTPTAPTAVLGTNTTQLATMAALQAAVAAASVGTAFSSLTLQNSWVLLSGRRAAYRKYNGKVDIEMGVSSGTATDGTVLATLPVGFRPASIQVFPVVACPATTPTTLLAGPRAVVNTDGTITCQNCTNTTFQLFCTINLE